jgi:signal recognition particle subunit SEC65
MMAKQTTTALTDEALLEEVQAEIESMSADELEAAAHQAKLNVEVRKARTKSYVKSEEAKERQRIYNKKRNIKLKLLAEKAEEMGIDISDKEVNARLAAS